MKNKIRILTALLLFAVISCVSGCFEASERLELVELSDWQSYTIVRPDMTDSQTTSAASILTNAIEEKLGLRLKLTTDWVNRGEEMPVGTKEILIGETNRPESQIGELKQKDFVVMLENDRIVITGGSGEAVKSACEWFIENCLDGRLYIPEGGYSYVGDYPLEAVKLGGIPLSQFRVDGGTDYKTEADELSERIVNGTGLYPTTDHTIFIENDAELSIFEVAVSFDGDLHITVNPQGDISEAIAVFDELLENRTEDDILPNERKVIEMENMSLLTEEQTNKWRKESDARISEILDSANMEIPEGASVYYVSPNGSNKNDGKTPETAWKTLDPVNNVKLAKGSYVCFERGGLWRGRIVAQEGVTYTAYGEGEKPKLYRSPFNGADAALWEKTDAENVWRIKLDENDVGTVVFNEGEARAIKILLRRYNDGRVVEQVSGEEFNSYHDLKSDLYFWHDALNDGYLYLCSEQNPGERFDSIEFNSRLNLFTVNKNDVTIDNLCIKYAGSHGIGASTVKNLTVKNCEFGWIGGSIQTYNDVHDDFVQEVRFGNAVEIWGGCDGYYVTDNYIYQVYDAGITQQYTLTTNDLEHNIDRSQRDIVYARNVIEYCNYSIEYWLGWNVESDNKSTIDGFLIEDNYMWYAGHGFCEQRPNVGYSQHIRCSTGTWKNRAKNFVIRENLFYESDNALVQTWSSLLPEGAENSLPSFYDNDFFQYAGRGFGIVYQSTGLDTGMKTMKYDIDIAERLKSLTESSGDRFWILEEQK